jgi:hypothetical protein
MAKPDNRADNVPVASPRGAASALFDVRKLLYAPGSPRVPALARDGEADAAPPRRFAPPGSVGACGPEGGVPGGDANRSSTDAAPLEMPSAAPAGGGSSAGTPRVSPATADSIRVHRCCSSERFDAARSPEALRLGSSSERPSPRAKPEALEDGGCRAESPWEHRASRGGNTAMVQRTCTWSKTLRSRLEAGTGASVPPSGAGARRRLLRRDNGERASPTVNGQDNQSASAQAAVEEEGSAGEAGANDAQEARFRSRAFAEDGCVQGEGFEGYGAPGKGDGRLDCRWRG